MQRFSNVALIFLSIVLAFTSCDKTEEGGENEIIITVIQPTNQEIVDKSLPVELKVDFEASKSLHDINLLILSQDSLMVEVLRWEGHFHQKFYSFSETLDLSGFPSGTEFKWEIEACISHECNPEDFIRENIFFTVQ